VTGLVPLRFQAMGARGVRWHPASRAAWNPTAFFGDFVPLDAPAVPNVMNGHAATPDEAKVCFSGNWVKAKWPA